MEEDDEEKSEHEDDETKSKDEKVDDKKMPPAPVSKHEVEAEEDDKKMPPRRDPVEIELERKAMAESIEDERLRKIMAGVAMVESVKPEKHEVEEEEDDKKLPPRSDAVEDEPLAESVKPEKKKEKAQDYTFKRLIDAQKQDMKGINGAFFAIKTQNNWGNTKVNPTNYTEEGNARFAELFEQNPVSQRPSADELKIPAPSVNLVLPSAMEEAQLVKAFKEL